MTSKPRDGDQPANASQKSLRIATSGSALFALATLLSRFLGLLRDSIAARLFGAGLERDMYLVAQGVAFQSVAVIVTAANAAVLPVLAWAARSGTDTAGGALAVLVTVGPAIVAATTAVFLAAGPLARVLSGGKPPAASLLSSLLRLSVWYVPVAGLANIAVTVPLADQRYLVPALAYAAPNVAVLAVMLTTYKRMGISSLTVADLAGGAFFALIVSVYVSLRYFRRPHLRPDWRIARQAGVLAVAPALQAVALMIAGLLERSVMAKLRVGLLSVYDYSATLMNVAVGALLAGPITVVASFLAYEAGKRDAALLARRLEQALAGVLVLAVFGAAVLIANAPLAVAVIYRGMRFDEAAAQATAGLVGWHAAPVLTATAADVLARGCNAMHDTLSPALAWTGGQLLRVALLAPLARQLGAPGVALAALAGFFFVAVTLSFMLRVRGACLPWLNIAARTVRLALIGTVSGLAITILPAPSTATLLENLAVLILRATVQLVVFGALIVLACPFERDLLFAAARRKTGFGPR
ncbi:MAG: hypothetical protein H5T86_02965 [Armatimonadetes bacterium]|nr:hypothetical protein [Armatimonadota bacterium]